MLLSGCLIRHAGVQSWRGEDFSIGAQTRLISCNIISLINTSSTASLSINEVLYLAVAMPRNAFTVLACATAPLLSEDLCLDTRYPAYNKDTAPVRVVIDGIEYGRRKQLKIRNSRKGVLKIHVHGEALIRGDKKEVYYCYDCENRGLRQVLPILDSTKGGCDYLRIHGRDPDTGELLPKIQLAGAKDSQVVADLVAIKDFDLFQ